MGNYDTNQKKQRFGKQERKSFFRRIRIPLLTAAGTLLTAFVIIPASFDILGISPVVVQIAEEMANIPSPSPTMAPVESEPTEVPEEPLYRLLKVGDTDPVVAQIQERLAELNYIDGDEPSETFGEPVAAALKRFQRVHHMTETGEAYALTQEILFSDDAAYYRLQQGDEGEDVESMQERLYELGYEVEKKNGYFGVATAKALSSFQT
ncbi:MAG: peptidoglycan-binding protein, partial [Clostridia bacterium]|nr:peptidoglycan-binding protein [Clostridia bacterium]